MICSSYHYLTYSEQETVTVIGEESRLQKFNYSRLPFKYRTIHIRNAGELGALKLNFGDFKPMILLSLGKNDYKQKTKMEDFEWQSDQIKNKFKNFIKKVCITTRYRHKDRICKLL